MCIRDRSVPFAEAFGTFATLEEAVGRLETLRALQLQVDRNAYLKAVSYTHLSSTATLKDTHSRPGSGTARRATESQRG